MTVLDSRRYSHRSPGGRMWLDGREPSYRLHGVLPIFLGHERKLLPGGAASICSLRKYFILFWPGDSPTQACVRAWKSLICSLFAWLLAVLT